MRQTTLRAATLLLTGALALIAQSGTGTISGTVINAQDAAIPGAEVTIRNTATVAVLRGYCAAIQPGRPPCRASVAQASHS